jgi:hypothetical protein
MRYIKLAFLLLASPFAYAADIPAPARLNVIPVKDQPSVPGPSENFTGTVHGTAVVKGADPSALNCGWVKFQPGSRSNWHRHPKGQLLLIARQSWVFSVECGCD